MSPLRTSLSCSPGAPTPQPTAPVAWNQALARTPLGAEYDTTVRYCGLGNDTVLTPRVADCVNRSCFEHDHCYSCDPAIPLSCFRTDGTKYCDRKLASVCGNYFQERSGRRGEAGSDAPRRTRTICSIVFALNVRNTLPTVFCRGWTPCKDGEFPICCIAGPPVLTGSTQIFLRPDFLLVPDPFSAWTAEVINPDGQSSGQFPFVVSE